MCVCVFVFVCLFGPLFVCLFVCVLVCVCVRVCVFVYMYSPVRLCLHAPHYLPCIIRHFGPPVKFESGSKHTVRTEEAVC